MQRNERKERQDRLDARDQEEHDARMAERRVKTEGDKALQTAAQPATVTTGANGATLPATMDNRDVGLPENADLPNQGLNPGMRVGAQTFTDPAAADAAAAAANQPQTVRGRQVAALQGIDPERALRLEKTVLDVDTAQAERSRKLKEEGVFDAMRAFRSGDAKGMKEAFNKSGQFKIDGDVSITPEVRDVPGVGQINTYNATFNAIGPDGKPVTRTFNSHDLSMQMMPYEKSLELLNKGTKTASEGKKSDADVKESEAKAGYYKSAAGEKDYKANGGAGGKPFKLDEDDKLKLTTANTRVRDAEKTVADAMKTLLPGDDPTKSPGVVYAQNLLRDAKRSHLKTNIELGQIPATSIANDIVSAAKSPQDIKKSLTELSGLAGKEYADQVAAEIEKHSAPAKKGGETKIDPATQAARDADRAAILKTELAQAQQRLANGDPRAQGDIDALNKELGRAAPAAKPKPAAAAGMGAPAAPAATAAAAPAQPAASPQQLEAMIATENAEMGAGKRLKYSPEAQAYLQQKRAEQQAAADAQRLSAGQRAVAASRGLGALPQVR